jgi:hypothetical protein
MLPTEKSEVKKELWQYHWMVYGAPKVGKSSFVAEFNDPLFICTEDRHKHLNIFKIPQEGAIKSWKEIKAALGDIKKSIDSGDFKWRTVVIDTIDNAYKFCAAHVLKEAGCKHESELEWGKGYALIKEEFFSVFSYLCSLGVAVVFVSHSEEKSMTSRSLKITKTVPSLPASGKKVLMPLVDIIGYVGFHHDEENKRMLYLEGTETLEAGCATSVKMPASLPLDYQTIEKEFKKGAK